MSPLFQHNENKIFSYIIMFQISITCLLYFTETRTGQPASYNLCTSFFTTSDQKFEPCEMLTSNTSKGQPLSFLQLFSSLLSLFFFFRSFSFFASSILSSVYVQMSCSNCSNSPYSTSVPDLSKTKYIGNDQPLQQCNHPRLVQKVLFEQKKVRFPCHMTFFREKEMKTVPFVQERLGNLGIKIISNDYKLFMVIITI